MDEALSVARFHVLHYRGKTRQNSPPVDELFCGSNTLRFPAQLLALDHGLGGEKKNQTLPLFLPRYIYNATQVRLLSTLTLSIALVHCLTFASTLRSMFALCGSSAWDKSRNKSQLVENPKVPSKSCFVAEEQRWTWKWKDKLLGNNFVLEHVIMFEDVSSESWKGLGKVWTSVRRWIWEIFERFVTFSKRTQELLKEIGISFLSL